MPRTAILLHKWFSKIICSSGSWQDIEQTLNLAENEGQEWTYSKDADAWVLSIVSAVTYPELPDQQGVSVCVPGAYIKGIDTDGSGNADVPSEALGDSFSLYVDQMYGEYVNGAISVSKPEEPGQTKNGTAETATGEDISEAVKKD